MTVAISSPDKLLFPADGLSKADIADYYEAVAEWMLPHVRDRPMSLMRFPDGIEGEGFFQKNTPDHYPRFIRRVEADKRGGTVDPRCRDERRRLVYLVGQNTITPHVWLSRADKLRQPGPARVRPRPGARRGLRRASGAPRAGPATCCARSGSSRSPR